MKAVKIKARIKDNLIDVIDSYFDGSEGHRSDPVFAALAERISGKVVTLRIIGGDTPDEEVYAFEEVDNNYWLPDCCWEEVE